jgi:hypothetical protein
LKSRRAGVPPGEGLAIEIAPRGRAAEELAIEIAPWGRSAGRPPSRTLLRLLRGWRLEIAPRGRFAEGLAIGNRAVRACRRASTFVDAAPSAAGLAIGNRAVRAFC